MTRLLLKLGTFVDLALDLKNWYLTDIILMALKNYFNLLVAVILCLLFLVVTYFNLQNSQSFFNQQLAQQGQFIGNALVHELTHLEQSTESDLEKHLANYRYRYDFNLLSLQHGERAVFSFYDSSKSKRFGFLSYVLSFDNPMVHKSLTLNQRDYTLQFQLSPQDAMLYVERLVRDTSIIFVVFLMLTLLVFRFAIRVIKEPIELLNKHTQKIANKDFEKLPEVNSVAEMNALMSNHNRMTHQVKEMINELTHRLEHAKNALYRDELTQLGNRRLFSAQFNQLLNDEKQQSGALLIMRLTELETVRRKEGFLVARSLLEDVIHNFQSHSKQGANGRTYRLNDNEFACIIQHITRNELAEVLKRLATDLVRLQSRYQQKKEILVGAVMWQGQDTMSNILKAADEALLLAGKARFGYHLFEPSEHVYKISELLSSKEGVMQTIKNAELAISQQSVLMSDQMSLMFSEVLSRFEFENHTIPTPLLQTKAEKFSASAQLDKRILNQVRTLYIKGVLDLPVSINVSVYSVLDDEYYAWLLDQSHQFGDLFSSIIWEFDEQMLAHSQAALTVVSKLHKLGSKVAIDHFGTGDSTLSALRKWPVDIVKLDGSFIHELEQQQDAWYFLENIIKLAHSLGIVVVCEQLESEMQVQYAKKLGSDGLQGFKLAMPHVVT